MLPLLLSNPGILHGIMKVFPLESPKAISFLSQVKAFSTSQMWNFTASQPLYKCEIHSPGWVLNQLCQLLKLWWNVVPNLLHFPLAKVSKCMHELSVIQLVLADKSVVFPLVTFWTPLILFLLWNMVLYLLGTFNYRSWVHQLLLLEVDDARVKFKCWRQRLKQILLDMRESYKTVDCK